MGARIVRATVSAMSKIKEPMSGEAMRRKRWSPPKSRRAMCGPRRPMNAIVPKKETMTAERIEAVSIPKIRTTLVRTPSAFAESSPLSIALKSHRYHIARSHRGIKTILIIANAFQFARPRSPKVHETIDASWTEFARYCIRVRPAEKIEPIAIPAKTML